MLRKNVTHETDSALNREAEEVVVLSVEALVF
jgi:hypothetical protein